MARTLLYGPAQVEEKECIEHVECKFPGYNGAMCVCDNKTKEIYIRMLVGYWGWILLLGTCKLLHA